jgi:hypothetical protein
MSAAFDPAAELAVAASSSARRTVAMPGRWLLAVIVALVAGCTSEPAEQRLRAAIAAVEAAVEARAAADVLEHVASDFVGGDGDVGGMDRRQLHALLRGMLLRHRDVGVLLGPLALTMHGEDRATVRVDALVTGGAGGLLPSTGRRIRIDSGWRLDDGDWRCISARWGDAAP